MGQDLYFFGWVVGWEEKWGLKLTSVEVEAELGNSGSLISLTVDRWNGDCLLHRSVKNNGQDLGHKRIVYFSTFPQYLPELVSNFLWLAKVYLLLIIR